MPPMESIGGTEILPANDRGQSASPGQYLSIAGFGKKPLFEKLFVVL